MVKQLPLGLIIVNTQLDNLKAKITQATNEPDKTKRNQLFKETHNDALRLAGNIGELHLIDARES